MNSASPVLVATRVHRCSVKELLLATEDVRMFLEACPTEVAELLVCVGVTGGQHPPRPVAEQFRVQLAGNWKIKVTVREIRNWGMFTQALNEAVEYARSESYETLLFLSLEARLSVVGLKTLQQYLQSDVLVVGAALPGHDFQPGSKLPVTLRGRTCPWNTMALWSVAKMSRGFFHTISDGDETLKVAAGIEEVVAISLQQHRSGGATNSKAALVQVPGTDWQTDFTDAARWKSHEEKMSSKDTRAESQLKALGIRGGGVWHLSGGECDSLVGETPAEVVVVG